MNTAVQGTSIATAVANTPQTSVNAKGPSITTVAAAGQQGPPGPPGTSAQTLLSTFAGLPASPSDGQIALVTDNYRGLYHAKNSRWIHSLGNYLNVQDYGAVPDWNGSTGTDNQAAFQACCNDAVAKSYGVLVPAPPYPLQYMIGSPVTIQSPDSTPRRLHMLAMGHTGSIQFTQSNSKCFELIGMYQSVFDNVKIGFPNSVVNSAAWDFTPTSSLGGNEGMTWRNCLVTCGTGGNNKGWVGNTAFGASDFSFHLWENCAFNAQSAVNGDFGWWNLGQNCLPWTLVGCSMTNAWGLLLDLGIQATLQNAMDAVQNTLTVNYVANHFPANGGTIQIDSEQMTYATRTTTGLQGLTRGVNGTTATTHNGSAAVLLYPVPSTAGATDITLVNCATHGGYMDLWLDGAGTYNVFGGRFEVGGRHVRLGTSGNTFPINFTEIGASLNGYGGVPNGPVNVVWEVLCGGNILLQNNRLVNGTGSTLSNNMIRLATGTGGIGALTMLNGAYSVSDPPYNVVSGTWRTDVHNVMTLSNTNTPTGWLTNNWTA